MTVIAGTLCQPASWTSKAPALCDQYYTSMLRAIKYEKTVVRSIVFVSVAHLSCDESRIYTQYVCVCIVIAPSRTVESCYGVGILLRLHTIGITPVKSQSDFLARENANPCTPFGSIGTNYLARIRTLGIHRAVKVCGFVELCVRQYAFLDTKMQATDVSSIIRFVSRPKRTLHRIVRICDIINWPPYSICFIRTTVAT
jgi:hypothetical protein